MARQFNQPFQLSYSNWKHRVSYSVKMGKTVSLGLQNVSGSCDLMIGPTPETLGPVARIGFEYSLGLGVVIGQHVGNTTQLSFPDVPPNWYVELRTSGNADFSLEFEHEQPFNPN